MGLIHMGFVSDVDWFGIHYSICICAPFATMLITHHGRIILGQRVNIGHMTPNENQLIMCEMIIF